jgi:hypothetical protein
MDAFTRGYLACAFWSELDESRPDGGDPLENNYSIDDLSPLALCNALNDCRRFQHGMSEYLKKAYAKPGYPPDRAGYDFWLTRNGHGAGFWDRDLGEVGEVLTAASHACGEVDLMVGDDKQIHSYP